MSEMSVWKLHVMDCLYYLKQDLSPSTNNIYVENKTLNIDNHFCSYNMRKTPNDMLDNVAHL